MKINLKFIGIIRYFSLISVILLPHLVAGQQTGSAPLITLVRPFGIDSLNNSGLALVKAEIISRSSLQTFRIFDNGTMVVNETGKKLESKDSITYVFERLIPLQKGENIIYVDAKNSKGWAISVKRIITSQLEPYFTWVLPASVNSTTESGKLIVKAEIKTGFDLLSTRINLNGNLLADEKGGITPRDNEIYIFERRIQLKTGRNTVFITTSNSKGSTSSAIRYINYSPLGLSPVITLVSPSGTDSLNNSGLALVKAEIASRSELQTFRIYDNGTMVVNETGKKLESKDSITYVFERLIPLQKGENIIYVDARNLIGKSISEKRTVTCQLEPFVTWLLPSTANSNSESGMLTVKAEIKTGSDLQSVSINLNGTQLAEEKGGFTPINNDIFIYEKNIQLKPGKNSIYIAANNTKGATNSKIRYVNYLRDLLPVITMISPSPTDTLNNSGLIFIKAEVVSFTGLQTIRVFHNRTIAASEANIKLDKKDSVTYLINTFVPLQAGLNTIYLNAKNSIGYGSSEKRNITCQLEPIIKLISPSSPNTTVGSGTVNIKAEIITNFNILSTSINFNGTVLTQGKEGITQVSNDTYSFEKSVPLSAGVNSIILIASNAKGTSYSNKFLINYVPGTVSEINWILPVASKSDTYKSEFPVSANIKTKSVIKSTHLILNGNESPSSAKTRVTPKNTQEYLYEDILNLKPGANTFELSAITDAGTIVSEKRVIDYQVPEIPVLAWKNPLTDQSVNQAAMDVRLGIKSTVNLENIAVYVNGKILDNISLTGNVKKENEEFLLGCSIPLKQGENNIYVVAGNTGGTSTSETRNIKYIIPSMPLITWGSPEAGVSSITASTITIRANISSTTDLKDLKMYLNEKVLENITPSSAINQKPGEYQVEKELTLNQGENRIYIIAENSAGSSTSETRSVNLISPSAPAVTWISPSRQNNVINLNSAKIRVSIKSSDKLQSLLVYVNGVASEEVSQLSAVNPQGEFTLEKSINLQPGDNNIYMVATNNNGTTRSEDRYLNNPPANPPVVSWTNPVDPATLVNSEMVLIEACIKSAAELKSAQIIVNGVEMATVMTFQTSQTGDCNYSFAKSVILKEGDNSIYINATNIAGSNYSEKRSIRFTTTAVAEKRLALIFGNADYGTSSVLKNPVNDANLMEGTLKTLGFEVMKHINAKKTEMEQAIREFSEKLPQYNVALFYYAGHGVQVDGENYLIPTDAALNKQTDCQWEAIQVNKIVRQFEQVPENINIVILDACRDNPFRSWSRGGAQGFRAINSVSGTIISFATAEGSTAADGSGSNGTFTEELVKQMNIPQSLSNVFNNTRKQVMKRTNNMQRPLEMNGLTGDFYFKK